MIVVARLENAVPPDNGAPDGQTEVLFEQIIRPGEAIKGRKSIVVARQIDRKEKFLVALEKTKNGVDVQGGTPLDADGSIVKYVRGALQLKDKSPAARLRYNVDFLIDPCGEVARSAQLEISRANYADLRRIAEKLKPEPLLKALTTDDMPIAQRGTLAMLLGHCGKKEHAVVVRKLLDAWDSTGDASSLHFAYILLDPEAGWAYATQASVTAADKEGSFQKRYAAFKAIRQLNEDRRDLVSQTKRDDALLAILKVKDMADFAIEFLRRHKRWEHANAIFDLSGKEGYQAPVIRRSILRFALQCPSFRATIYVNEQRARDPEWVSETAELLELEDETQNPPKK
jgi:hypothetical protein